MIWARGNCHLDSLSLGLSAAPLSLSSLSARPTSTSRVNFSTRRCYGAREGDPRVSTNPRRPHPRRPQHINDHASCSLATRRLVLHLWPLAPGARGPQQAARLLVRAEEEDACTGRQAGRLMQCRLRLGSISAHLGSSRLMRLPPIEIHPTRGPMPLSSAPAPSSAAMVRSDESVPAAGLAPRGRGGRWARVGGPLRAGGARRPSRALPRPTLSRASSAS